MIQSVSFFCFLILIRISIYLLISISIKGFLGVFSTSTELLYSIVFISVFFTSLKDAKTIVYQSITGAFFFCFGNYLGKSQKRILWEQTDGNEKYPTPIPHKKGITKV